MTARPHDALFRSAFEDPAGAAALLRELLPAAFRDGIAWDTIQGEPGSFVGPMLTDRHSDLLFSGRLRTGPGALLYFLLEHQSTLDPEMPLRALSYQTLIWTRFRKGHPAAWLPPIITVLVSHVPGGWTTARSLDDMLDPSALALPGLPALTPRSSLIIEDLVQLSNTHLQTRSLAAFQKLALWLLRDARDPRRLLDNFGAWIDTFAEAERASTGGDAIATLLTYLLRVIDPVHRDELRAKIHQLGPHIEESAMTIAEQLHEEGREEGRIAALRALLTFKFGSQAVDGYEAALRAATPDVIDRYLPRVLTADSIAAVFAG